MDIGELNKCHSVYFIGIGGISMSALAEILHARGMDVRGYDRSFSGLTEHLESIGIPIWYGDDHRKEAFDGVDLVCYTAAVLPDHPQMVLASQSGAHVVSRAELLGCIASSYPRSVAVAGTHGKSTTSGMLSHLFLNCAGNDPTFVVGAVVPDVNSTFHIGTDDRCVFEACEYKDSFLSFYPETAVVLNIELDHTDYFHSIGQMIESFRIFLSHTGPEGTAVVNADSPNCALALAGYPGRVVRFGIENAGADYTAKNIDLSDGYGRFDLYRGKDRLFSAHLRIPGIHNISNALAAAAVADLAGMPADVIRSGLESYTGVQRRFEYIGTTGGADFYDDYAHHPDEIRATLSAARGIAKGRVICAFQPHNYSRLRDLFSDFGNAFSDADELILTKLYAPREAAQEDYTSARLASLIGATYIEEMEDLTPYLLSIARPGDVILYMGAGSIEKEARNYKNLKNKA